MTDTTKDAGSANLESELFNRMAELARWPHYTCEDCWYSCPKSGECCNDNAGEECNCGADAHNKKVDELLLAWSNR